MMSCKLLLNLVESIRVKSEQDTGARELLDGGVHTQVQSHSAVPDPRNCSNIVSHHPVTLGSAPAMRQLSPPAHPMEMCYQWRGEFSFSFFFTNEPARRYVTGGS